MAQMLQGAHTAWLLQGGRPAGTWEMAHNACDSLGCVHLAGCQAGVTLAAKQE